MSALPKKQTLELGREMSALVASDRAIRVGGVMPLSRPGFLEAGRHLKAGLELAVADVNGLGGVGGRPLELLVRDTGAGPAKAVAIVDELHKDGVAAIAGEYHSVVARAIAARATQLGLAFVCSSAVLDSLTNEPSRRRVKSTRVRRSNFLSDRETNHLSRPFHRRHPSRQAELSIPLI